MANIIINIAAKIFINFSPATVELIRNEINPPKIVTVSYTLGTGQILPAGEIYSDGTPGQPGYIQVVVPTQTTINGSGNVQFTVNAYPTATAADGPLTFSFDQSNITFNIDYNSRPGNTDVVINNLVNRGTHDFTTAEFINQFSDYDTDNLSEIQINDNTTGYEYDLAGLGNYQPYVSGTWIPVNNITRLRYKAENQNNAYSKINDYKVKDSNGLIST